MSSRTVVVRQIAMCVYDDFLDKKKELPSTFDGIPLLYEWIHRDSHELSFINTLAIVPNTPKIIPEKGISERFSDYKLFAISRNKSFDKVVSSGGGDRKLGGRYAILINLQNSDIVTNWIPEKEAQIILRQFKGFDPKKQPLAFQDLIQSSVKNIGVQEGVVRRAVLTNNGQRPTSPAASSFQSPSERPTDYVPFWIGGGILFVSLVTWDALRRSKSIR